MLILYITSILATISLTAADPKTPLIPAPKLPWLTTKISLANPTPNPTPNPIRGHYACQDANFTGGCNYWKDTVSECHTYPKEVWGAYTSLGPDEGQVCWFFDAEECFGSKIELKFPGSKNLRGRRWDHRVRSWKCWVNL